MKRPLLLMLTTALAACAQTPRDSAVDAPAAAPATRSSGTAQPSLLTDYRWRLAQANDAQGQRLDALFVSSGQPVQFDFRNGKLAVGNTCNGMSGAYTVIGDQLKVGALISTKKACADAALMALDQEIGKRLRGPLTLSMRADDKPRLTLASASGDRLMFIGEPTADTYYGSTGETVFLEVGPQTVPCRRPPIGDAQCLQVRQIRYDGNGVRIGTGGEFRDFFDSIAGYTHAPGVRNVLRVKRYKIADPPADASAYAYALDLVVESEAATP